MGLQEKSNITLHRDDVLYTRRDQRGTHVYVQKLMVDNSKNLDYSHFPSARARICGNETLTVFKATGDSLLVGTGKGEVQVLD